ncbi:hypothetical protein ABZ914_49375, partial [Spirillospora sp. NPDC046719]
MRTLYSVRLEGVATNPAAPVEYLLLILERAEPRMRHALLRRAGVPDAVYEAAVRHPDPHARRLVAVSGHAPAEIRALLADDPDPDVRRSLAAIPEHWEPRRPLPADVVVRLAADPDPRVREAVLDRDLPDGVRAALAADPDARVRWGVLCTWPDPPDEIVDAALDDPDPEVRRAAVALAADRRPDVAAPLLAAGAPDVVARVPLDAGQAVALSRDGRARVREAVAANTSVPPGLLAVLARDPEHKVRLAAAANPSLPPDLVAELADDPEHEVRLAVSLRPELTEEQRAAIDYRVGPEDRLRPPEWLWDRLDDLDLMRRYAASAHTGLRRFAAYSPHLPPDLVARLAGDEDFVVRLLLSEKHPDPPGELLLSVALESPFITRLDRTGHPNFPCAGLARLAESDDPVARTLALRDPELPAPAVERLSRDEEPGVRAAA